MLTIRFITKQTPNSKYFTAPGLLVPLASLGPNDLKIATSLVDGHSSSVLNFILLATWGAPRLRRLHLSYIVYPKRFPSLSPSQAQQRVSLVVYLRQPYNQPSSPILHVLSTSMSGIGPIGEEQVRREIGSLFDSERWWRDQYRVIENDGYRLRPRYHPEWEPSWKTSGKPFFTMEDGQPTLVSVVCQMFPTLTLASVTNCDGRNTLAGWETSHAQEGSCGKGTGD